MNIHSDEQGFGPMVVVLASIVLLVFGFTTFKILQNSFLKTGGDTTGIKNDFAECVAAGNPVQESYPETCVADGKSYTNPDQTVNSDDLEIYSTENWLEYTSAKDMYKIRIPDGWKLTTVSDQEVLYGLSTDSLKYKPGTNGSVGMLDEAKISGVIPFRLYANLETLLAVEPRGEKVGVIKTGSGGQFSVYSYVTTDKDMNYKLGSKVYAYSGPMTAEYVVEPDKENQHQLVEQMLKTLTIN